jgi:hypothetical protein
VSNHKPVPECDTAGRGQVRRDRTCFVSDLDHSGTDVPCSGVGYVRYTAARV